MRKLEFYVDGAYSSKTEMGGWAAICLEDGMIIDEKTGYEPYSTNNRMEIMAVYSALLNASTIETTQTEVTIYTDSALVARTFNEKWYANWLKNGWKTADKQSVKNQDLWLPVIALYIKIKDRLHLKIDKVKAHKDCMWNKYADRLAVRARQELE